MSQKVNYTQFITTRQRQQNKYSPSFSKHSHVFSLDFNQTKIKSSAPKYKTIDQILMWKSTRSKLLSKYGRKTTINIKQADGDVMASIELSRMNDGNQIISYRDKQHFQYLVKALTGIKKGKKFSQIQRYKAKQQNHQTQSLLSKQKNQSPNCNFFSYESELENKKQSRKNNLIKDVVFKKILQNQQRNKSRMGDMDFTILGQQQLKINKISCERYLKGR